MTKFSSTYPNIAARTESCGWIEIGQDDDSQSFVRALDMGRFTVGYNLVRHYSMRKDTKNWIALTDYDIDTARHMLATGRYLYVIFLCHLSLEKILKAHVAEVTQTLPIKTHDLIYLVKKSELELPETYLDFIGKINTASIPTRYPDDLQRSLKEYPEPVARDYLEQTEKILQWLKQHPNLSE
jgi:HEPN domain-containing protein